MLLAEPASEDFVPLSRLLHLNTEPEAALRQSRALSMLLVFGAAVVMQCTRSLKLGMYISAAVGAIAFQPVHRRRLDCALSP